MLFKSSPIIQVHFMNGVSDITFPKPLSTQDKYICCIVKVAKKERRKERRKRMEEGNIKESATYY